MNCEHVLHHIDAYVRDELDTATATEVAAHLATCASCIRQVVIAKMVRAALDQITPEPNQEFVDRLVARATTEKNRGAMRRNTFYALAAMLVVGITLSISMRRDTPQAIVPIAPVTIVEQPPKDTSVLIREKRRRLPSATVPDSVAEKDTGPMMLEDNFFGTNPDRSTDARADDAQGDAEAARRLREMRERNAKN